MNSAPNLTSLFMFEMLAVLALGSTFLFLAIYVVRENRSSARSRMAAKESSWHEDPPPLTDTGFYYQKTGRLGSSKHMKVRLYSREDYEGELGGDRDVFGAGGFVAALKAYGYYGDHWHEMPSSQAMSCLGLKAEDCEAHGHGGTLLLRRLPKGLPARAREKLDQPEELRLFAGDGGALRDAGTHDRKYRG